MFPVEAFFATLNKAVEIFRKHDIPFHLTGGITSIYYGEPRMTQDIDIVVDNPQMTSQLKSVLEALKSSDFIFDADSIGTAVKDKGMFQLLDGVESLKLDIYPRELIPVEPTYSSRSKFNKSSVVSLLAMLLPSSKLSARSRLVW